MTEIHTESTSAGRVVNNAIKDVDKVFIDKFGKKWTEYRNRWANASNMNILEDFPLFVRFEAQFKCNSKCSKCVHGHADLEEDCGYKEYMPLPLFKRLIDECDEHKCPSVGVSQRNEPLLDFDLMERINYVSSKKNIMDIHLNTNASLLTEELSRKILDTGITRICFSIDALTEKTFNKVRNGLNFSQVLHNIETFLSIREKTKQSIPTVRVSFLLQEDNEHEVEEFKKYWVNKADYVSVQRYVPISPFSDERSHAIGLSPTKGKQRCSYTYESLFVHGDGVVVPCAAHHSRHISVGSVNEKSLYDIWHSAALNQIREAIKSDNLQNTLLCANCLY